MTGEREEEKIMPSLMATSLRWPTHSARTKIEKHKAQAMVEQYFIIPYVVKLPFYSNFQDHLSRMFE